MSVKGIGKELRRRRGERGFRGFLLENDKVGFEERDAVAIAEHPGRVGVYDGLKDSVGTMRLISLEVDVKVVKKRMGLQEEGMLKILLIAMRKVYH